MTRPAETQLFCDRLSFGSFRYLVLMRFKRGVGAFAPSVLVLDAVAETFAFRFWSRCLALVGFSVEEAEFRAGTMKTDAGISPFLSARWTAFDRSYEVADDFMQDSARLTRVARDWRGHLRLYIAQSTWLDLERLCMRLEIAQILANAVGRRAHVVQANTLPVSSQRLADLVSDVGVTYYRQVVLPFGAAVRAMRSVGGVLGAVAGRAVGRRASEDESADAGPSAVASGGVNPLAKSLLMVQEDAIGSDRSIRTQPHWIFLAEKEALGFPALVVLSGGAVGADLDELETQGVHVIAPPGSMAQALISSPRTDLDRELRLAAWGFLRGAVLSWRVADRWMWLRLRKLFTRARSFEPLCRRHNVGCFLVSEPYLLDARAILLIARNLGIKTIGFQYSNVAKVSPVLATTVDTFATFSDTYHAVWSAPDQRPKEFVSIGYVFDSSFALVAERAAATRRKLQEAGAGFILCYLDENVQRMKYALVDDEMHMADLRVLLTALLEDDSLGLVIKPQFQFNVPGRFPELAELFDAAEKSGRYTEVSRGCPGARHRNILFPAEATMAADMAIGAILGGTACIEAALAGTRCILTNPYGFRGHLETFERANIVRDSTEAALEAIEKYRRGVGGFEDLGDWSSIVDEFDPFRDGRAAERLRRLVESALA